MWHFLDPGMLYWLPLALLPLFIGWLAWRRQAAMAACWATLRHRKSAVAQLSRRRWVIGILAMMLVFSAGIVGMAHLSMSNSTVEFPAGSTDIVVLGDVSTSMGAADCKGKTRNWAMRDMLHRKIVPSARGNAIGMIPFAGESEEGLYLTYETHLAEDMIESGMRINSARGGGSALGKAFETAMLYFDVDSKPDRQKVIILLSDGGTNEQTDLDKIIAECNARRIQLIVVALGDTKPAMIPVSELPVELQMKQNGQFYKDGDNVVTTGLDEGVLLKLAGGVKNGQYTRATSADDLDFEYLTSALRPQKRIAERELYLYPCVLVLLGLTVTALATGKWRARRSGMGD